MNVTAAFSLQQSQLWLKKCGSVLMSPLSLVCLLSLLKDHHTYVFNNLVVLLLSFVLGNVRQNNPGRVFIAPSILKFEVSILLGLPVCWTCGLLISILAVDVIERSSPQQNTLISYVGVNFALSSYERTCFCVVWSILLQRLVESTDAIYDRSTAPIAPNWLQMFPTYSVEEPIASNNNWLRMYPTYSVEQHLQVVEIVSMALLCVMLSTEVLVFTSTKFINALVYCMARKNHQNRTSKQNGSSSTTTLIYFRWPVFLLVAAFYTYYILLPQLQHINIHNLPLYILQLVFCKGYYEFVLCINWVLLISITVVVGFYAGSKWHWPRTCSRKLFHLLVVAMFVPCLRVCSKLVYYGLYSNTNNNILLVNYDGYQYRIFAFLVLALGVAVNIFVFFEYARLCLVPRTINNNNADSIRNTTFTTNSPAMPGINPVAAVEQYMQLFLSSPSGPTLNTTNNSPDLRGKLEISHISLLLGCAGPIWLFVIVLSTLQNDKSFSAEPVQSTGACRVTVPMMILSAVPYVGLLTLGVGDACAAVVGKLFGKHKWSAILTPGKVHNNGNKGASNVSNNRTMEGSCACFVSMVAFVMYVLYIQHTSLCGMPIFPPPVALWDVFIVLIVVCGLVTVVEAITMENDNVVLPVYACMLLIGSFVLF